MAKIIDCGLATRPNIRFGINHKYITKKLTAYNYRWYAIVRGDWYLYLEKVKIKESNKTTVQYHTRGYFWRTGRKTTLEYSDLHHALDDLNSLYDGHEGIYPPESENTWVVRPVVGYRHLSSSFDEPFAYQFTGFREEEE